MKLVMIHHFRQNSRLHLGKLPGPLLANFGPAGANVAQKNRLLEEENEYLHQLLLGKMLGYLQWTPNSPSMEIHSFGGGTFCSRLCYQDNAICDAGAQALYDVCSRRQRWVMGVVKQHPMVRGPLENWEHGGWVPTFVVRVLKTIKI